MKLVETFDLEVVGQGGLKMGGRDHFGIAEYQN